MFYKKVVRNIFLLNLVLWHDNLMKLWKTTSDYAGCSHIEEISVSVAEMNVFIRLLLQMWPHCSSSIEHYWGKNPIYIVIFCRSHMSQSSCCYSLVFTSWITQYNLLIHSKHCNVLHDFSKLSRCTISKVESLSWYVCKTTPWLPVDVS